MPSVSRFNRKGFAWNFGLSLGLIFLVVAAVACQGVSDEPVARQTALITSSAISSINDSIRKLETRLGDLEDRVGDLQSGASSLQRGVSRLQSNLDGLEYRTDCVISEIEYASTLDSDPWYIEC